MAAEHTHLIPKVDEWVPRILREIVPDEELTWEISFQVLPDPAMDDAWVPILIIYVEMPLPSGDNSIYSVTLIAPFSITEDMVRTRLIEAATELVAKMDDIRKRRPHPVVDVQLPEPEEAQ
jgi:hypothetical protein